VRSHITRLARVAAVLSTTLFTVVVPAAAHAVMVTFDWVPTSENPPSGPSTAGGSITLDLPSWTLTPISGNGLGPDYYTSGSATTATIAAFSYTFGNGVSVALSNLSTTTIGVPNSGAPPLGTVWATSAINTPASGAQAPSPPSAGYYLITQFAVSGSIGGTFFQLGNNAGTAGANYQNGIGNGGNNIGQPNGITDGGYWRLAPVPLPATLPLLLGGLALLARFRRRACAPVNCLAAA
jgi:hypothetical protein